jgi:hypothetical protein
MNEMNEMKYIRNIYIIRGSNEEERYAESSKE